MSLSRKEIDAVANKFRSGVTEQIGKLLRANAESEDSILMQAPGVFTYLQGVLFGTLVTLGADEETATARAKQFFEDAMAEFTSTVPSIFLPSECPPQLN
jgi:hypothetical protein